MQHLEVEYSMTFTKRECLKVFTLTVCIIYTKVMTSGYSTVSSLGPIADLSAQLT